MSGLAGFDVLAHLTHLHACWLTVQNASAPPSPPPPLPPLPWLQLCYVTRSNQNWFEMAVHMAAKGLRFHLTALNRQGSCDFLNRIREVFDFAHRRV